MVKLSRLERVKNLTAHHEGIMQKLFVVFLINTGALLLATNSFTYSDTTRSWHLSVSVPITVLMIMNTITSILFNYLFQLIKWVKIKSLINKQILQI